MSTNVLDHKLTIRVAISSDRVFEANLDKELSINTSDIVGEILSQPSKYAWWAVLEELSRRKLHLLDVKLGEITLSDEQYKDLLNQYSEAVEQHELLEQALAAFNYRKTALLDIWDNTSNSNGVLNQYRKNLSNLVALGQCSV